MNTSEYISFVRRQQLMAQPISNKPGENYIVATDDDNLISQYSKRFHNDGYNVEVIDLIDPVNSSASYDVLQQIESAKDAKWFANQLEAPWLQDDPYYQASMIFKCIAKSLYCQLYEMESATLPIKTNFLCKPQIFQSLCCDILGDSIAPLLGLCITCPGLHGADNDLSHILARALK